VGDIRTSAYVVLLCVLVALTACGTATVETQSLAQDTRQVRDTRQARLTFVREASLMYVAGAPTVRLNGQDVGRPASGSSFFVDRPPGRYDVNLEAPLVPGRFAASFNIKTAGNYYFKVVPRTEYFPILWEKTQIALALEAKIHEGSGAYALMPLSEQAATALLARMNAPLTAPVAPPDRN
jgi:hypothetical protein